MRLPKPTRGENLLARDRELRAAATTFLMHFPLPLSSPVLVLLMFPTLSKFKTLLVRELRNAIFEHFAPLVAFVAPERAPRFRAVLLLLTSSKEEEDVDEEET